MDKNIEMAERIAGLVGAAGGRTFYVGGFVRDELLHRENKDVDIEIHGITPGKLEEILDSLGERTVMGVSFGVFGLRHYDLDIAMPRRETSNGRGHKDFDVYVDPFIGTEKAAMRRDFTMNALMKDVLTGEILDHFGGISDMKKGIIRHVNDQTFAEDPLRVLRAAQFAARFGFLVAPETRELSRRMDLTALAPERILGETEKALLKAPRPSVFFEELKAMDQLTFWFPVMDALSREPEEWKLAMGRMDAAAALRREAEYPYGLTLTALGPKTEEMAGRITNVVKLFRYMKNMNDLREEIHRAAENRADEDTMAELYDRSVSPEDLILLFRVEQLAAGEDPAAPEAHLRKMLEEYRRRMALPFVEGKDLIQAGFTPGTRFGMVLEKTHRMRLHAVPKEDALAKACELLEETNAKAQNPGETEKK